MTIVGGGMTLVLNKFLIGQIMTGRNKHGTVMVIVETAAMGLKAKQTEETQNTAQGSQSVGSLVLSAVLNESEDEISEEFCDFSFSEQPKPETFCQCLLVSQDSEVLDCEQPFCFGEHASFDRTRCFCEGF